MIKLHTVGGFSEVGKNMAVLEFDEDAIVLDMGLFLPPIVELENRSGQLYNEKSLRAIHALPDDSFVKNIKPKIRAILTGHAHLDHIGAMPYIANNYKSDIFGTPYTIEVLKSLFEDSKTISKNKLRPVSPNSSIVIKGKNKKYDVEFLNITHSTIQTALIVIHTPKGAIIYANDFKFDNTPIFGKKPNYERLKQIAKQGVLALIVDSLYSGSDRKTPSEKIARGLLEDVLLTTHNENSGIIITSFSSHIARLKSIVDFGLKLNRKILFVGRSLNRYVTAASNISMAPFKKDVIIASYRNQIERMLRKADKNKKDWMVVCTGHQGEPGSILERISRKALPYNINNHDHVIFSTTVIPTAWTIRNRQILDRKLKQTGARIFTDVHVSGHCGREDLRDMINMLQPEHIIPAHGDKDKTQPMVELAKELGYKLGKNVHLMQDGKTLKLD